MGFPGGASGREPSCQCRRRKRQAQSPCQKDPLEKATATPSSILAWRIPMDRQPGELQSMGSQRVRHDLSELADTYSSAHFILFSQRQGLPWWLRG